MPRLAEVKKVKAVRSRKLVQSLRVDLTKEEQRIKGLDLAEQEKAIYDKEQAKRKAAEAFKEELELLTRRMTTCAQVLRQGYEFRPVECEEVYDYTVGSVTVKRLDNGQIVSERAMTGDERQMTFVADDMEERDGQHEAADERG